MDIIMGDATVAGGKSPENVIKMMIYPESNFHQTYNPINNQEGDSAYNLP